MPSSALHRFAILLAVCTLCLVAAVALAHAGILPESERLMVIVVAVLSIVRAGWVSMADRRSGVRLAAWVFVAGCAVIPLGAVVVKAAVAQLLFALAVALAVVSSPAWHRGPRLVEDEGVPSLRTLGWLVPLGVLAQMVLGAGLRYNALPMWPHLTGSMIVGAVLLFAGMAALQSYGSHESLKGVATLLMWMTGLQLTLGMAAYGVRAAANPEAWTVYLTAAHVVTGAATLGSATAFALQVFYHVRETLLGRQAAV